ncbi:MAG: hypothetical protein L6R45_04310 [Anaerolineae bacterium]|nr:hypothetical protein [Anaerolineae bacterium]
MMQDTQTLKAKIIALLDFLPADSLKVLAEFAAFLRTKSDSSVVQAEKAEIEFEITTAPRHRAAYIVSPHLVHREQAVDFKLEVIEEMPNDRL